MPYPFCASPNLSDFLIVIILFAIQGSLGFAARDTISLLSPPSKINELAAIRAERSMGIIFPLSFTVTGWALYPKRHSFLFSYPKWWRRKAPRLRAFFPSGLGQESNR